MPLNWTKWNKDIIKKHHGDIHFYRDLYEGEHAKLFARAQKLILDGEVTDGIIEGRRMAQQVRTPYIIANVAKLIPEIPAMLVSRAIGKVSPANDASYDKATQDLQAEVLDQIVDDSNLRFEHWTNIVQHQIDGGIVGVVWSDENGTRIEAKARDVYFPHEDGRGCDLVYERDIDDEDYLHVYTEEVDQGSLVVTNQLFKIKEGGDLEKQEDAIAKEKLGIEELVTIYEGRSKPFVIYWPNDKTFMKPLGTSALKNQESKQDEINWTLTRSALTFERNGKPRIAVSKEIFRALQEKAYDRYGDESKIDHRDLEITTFNEQGQAMEVIQIDITKIGDVEWVKDLMKLMFIETKTSEKAVDFYLDGGSASGGAVSGVAKFYDLFISIVKAEKIGREYISFLQDLFESALWLENELGGHPIEIPVEKPDIALGEMIPISRKELLETEGKAYTDGIQSRHETVKRIKPNDSEASVEDEVATLESEAQSANSTSLTNGRTTLANLLDNKTGGTNGQNGTEGSAGTAGTGGATPGA